MFAFDSSRLTLSTFSMTDGECSTPNVPRFGRPGSERAGMGLLEEAASFPFTSGVKELPPSRPSVVAAFVV